MEGVAMRGGAKAGVVSLALALLGGIAWWLSGDAGQAPPPDPASPALGGGADSRGVPRTGPSAPGRGDGADVPAAPAATDAEDAVPGVSFVIRGRVLDGGGRPIRGAAVEARDAALDLRNLDFFLIIRLVSEEIRPVAGTTTDADGRFTLKRVPRGRFVLWASAATFSPGFSAPLSPALQPAGHVEEIVLSPGFSVTGRIFLAGGAPVEGAVLRTLPEPKDPSFLLHRTSAVSDKDGRFSFEALLPGRYITFVSVPGRATRVFKDITVPADRPVDIEVPAGGALTVTVRGPGGSPVEGAAVVVMTGKGQLSFARGTTDGSGRATLVGLDPGPVGTVIAARAGFVPFGGSEDQAASGAPLPGIVEGETAEYSLELLRGAVVRGRVLDDGTGKPVTGALVRPTGDDFQGMMTGSASGVTGPDGSYRIESVKGGRQTLLVQAEGYAPPASAVAGGKGNEEFSVTVPERGEVEKDLRLHRAGEVAGSVTGPDGSPAAGATVRVLSEGGRFEELGFLQGTEGFADGEGRFRLAGLVPGAAVRVEARSPGFLPGISAEVKPSGGETVEGVSIRLGAGSSITGTVAAADGRPVAGALVAVAVGESNSGDSAIMGTRTDEAGRFAVKGAPPGERGVLVKMEGFIPAFQEVKVDEGRAAELRFTLEPAATITGRVSTEDGAPVPDAEVRARRSDGSTGVNRAEGFAKTDREGRFEVKDLPTKGVYDLGVHAEDRLPAVRENVPAGARDILLVAPAGALIGGRVVDDEGRPVAGAGIQLRRDGAGGTRWARTGADGEFEFRGLEPGDHILRPTDGGGNPDLVLEDGPRVAAGTRDVVVRLRRGARIAGRVVDPQGRGAKGVDVTAVPAGGKGPGRGVTSGDGGTFQLRGLPGGTYDLRARGGGYLEATKPGVAGDATDVVIEVRRGLIASGVAVGPEGNPVPGVRVTLKRSGQQWSQDADLEGRFRFDGLAEGDVEIGAWRRKEQDPLGDDPDTGWLPFRAGDEGIRVTIHGK